MDAQTEIERGIAAAQAGNQRTAYYYFYAATRADPSNEQAWLWRASAAPRPEEALNCLAAVLAINPDNPVARHGLEQISAAITAVRDQPPEVIVPSQGAQALSFQPPERRLAWQQAFQRDHYDPARVAHLAPQEDAPRPAPPPVVALAATRPGDLARPEERRQPMDRQIMRRRLILATAVPAVLVLALAYIVGLLQYAPATPGLPTIVTPGRTPAAALSATPLPPTVAVVNPTVPPAETVPPAADTPAPPVADTPVPPPPATDTPPPAPPATDTPAPPPPVSGEEIYTVVAGDTLQAIAGRMGRTLAAMMVFNNLTHPFDIQAGQVLKIPPGDFKPSELRHRVLPGETLTGIATIYAANVDAIVQANGLSDQNRIFAGQEIIIPLP